MFSVIRPMISCAVLVSSQDSMEPASSAWPSFERMSKSCERKAKRRRKDRGKEC